MNGNKAVIDSNVIIDASKGLISIVDILKENKFIYLSIVSYIEVVGFNFTNNDERIAVEELLDKIPVIDLGKEIADITVRYRKIRKIKLPDAIILATAKYLDASLITRNVDDFVNIDDNVIIINPKTMV